MHVHEHGQLCVGRAIQIQSQILRNGDSRRSRRRIRHFQDSLHVTLPLLFHLQLLAGVRGERSVVDERGETGVLEIGVPLETHFSLSPLSVVSFRPPFLSIGHSVAIFRGIVIVSQVVFGFVVEGKCVIDGEGGWEEFVDGEFERRFGCFRWRILFGWLVFGFGVGVGVGACGDDRQWFLVCLFGE